MFDKKDIYENVSALVDSKKEKFLKVSDEIWDYAETRFEEFKSAECLANALEDEGFSVERNSCNIETAFVGTWGKGSPVIGFLGEYDALSGLSQKAGEIVKSPIVDGTPGHGCGHNLLGAGALMAAVALKDYFAKNNLPGTVKYFGTPGEEGGSGKTYMVRDGAFDGVDICFTWHPGGENNITILSSLANIQAYFKFKGKSAHAAGSPENGRSALDAVELMNVGSNYLREHVPTTSRFHYAVVNTGGTAPNVVQAEAEVLYLVRAPKIGQAKNIYERICNIARGAALMTETQLEINFDKACSNYIPNIELSTLMYEVMQAIGPTAFNDADKAMAEKLRATLSDDEKNKTIGKTNNIADWQAVEEIAEGKVLSDFIYPYHPELKDVSSPGSTDVSDVSWVVPTAQFNWSTAPRNTSAHTWQWVSIGKSPIAHKGTASAAKVMAATAVLAYNNPEIIEKAKAELKKLHEKTPYENPIPKDVRPKPLNK